VQQYPAHGTVETAAAPHCEALSHARARLCCSAHAASTRCAAKTWCAAPPSSAQLSPGRSRCFSRCAARFSGRSGRRTARLGARAPAGDAAQLRPPRVGAPQGAHALPATPAELSVVAPGAQPGGAGGVQPGVRGAPVCVRRVGGVARAAVPAGQLGAGPARPRQLRPQPAARVSNKRQLPALPRVARHMGLACQHLPRPGAAQPHLLPRHRLRRRAARRCALGVRTRALRAAALAHAPRGVARCSHARAIAGARTACVGRRGASDTFAPRPLVGLS